MTKLYIVRFNGSAEEKPLPKTDGRETNKEENHQEGITLL